MRQLRGTINRIIKKIPDKKLEDLLAYLGARYPAEYALETSHALTRSYEREAELEKKLLEYLKEDEEMPPAREPDTQTGAPLQ